MTLAYGFVGMSNLYVCKHREKKYNRNTLNKEIMESTKKCRFLRTPDLPNLVEVDPDRD